jgi:hypothetical protein
MISQEAINLYKQRVNPLRHHPVQQEIIDDTDTIKRRFTVTHAGRRSGKTEIKGKRRLIRRAVRGVKAPNPRYFAGAPTRDQAKRLFWNDLKVMSLPFRQKAKPPSESHLIIYLNYDREIHVVGLDKPERIEGSHWDGGVLDEFGNMKKNTWEEHVRPALSTPGRPPAWCDFIGVPEGRNHYYSLKQSAEAEMIEDPLDSVWWVWHWKSAEVLPPEEIAQAKKDMDELTYLQEYEGSFVNFSGRAYYSFEDRNKARLEYDPKKPIGFCFDFNVEPGVAAVVQEKQFLDPETKAPIVGKTFTGVIGEVYIPRNSNTVLVCNKLISDWKDHQGKIGIYGDATGGSRGSAKILGNDWDLVKSTLTPHFGQKLIWKVPKSNPTERSRVNSVNSRCLSISGEIKLKVDPSKAPKMVKDMEGVTLVEGGSGEIDKKIAEELTHLSDALGYYIHKEFPVIKGGGVAKLGGA